MFMKTKLFVLSILLMSFAALNAQVTTSSMSGLVTDAKGAVVGAAVVATHTPSGTTYRTITNVEGRYNLNGMRVGGPYTVVITYVGYGKSTTNNITLSLGENYA
ncbi:MAG: oar, partial [Bacteroidetes bacterium]|nr:oar [Bacteroidota bacterium]